MNFLSRINRGLILTLLVIAAVTVYLVSQSASRNKMKPEIKDACSNYIETVISYSMLPEDYRAEKPGIPQAELDRYIDNMEKDIKSLYTDKGIMHKHLISQNKSSLKNQAAGADVVFSYKKDIIDFKEISFEKDTVTATVVTDVKVDRLVQGEREKISGQTTDTITLQRENGNWKVVYAYLQQPALGGNFNGVEIMRSFS